MALRDLEPEVVLHTFFPAPEDVKANFGDNAVVHKSSALISFHYLYPLARPRIVPVSLPEAKRATVSGDRVIRFGCLEGDFVVKANIAIYDPQAGVQIEPFRANGSQAQRLALVLNADEARLLAGDDDLKSAASGLRKTEGADVVVVKEGPAGALVFGGNPEPSAVPAYRTRSVFKIGSGDVFTAMFAHHWATRGRSPEEAADAASRHVATYVSNRTLPCGLPLEDLEPVGTGLDNCIVRLAMDGCDTPTEWLAEEAEAALRSLGARRIVHAFVPPQSSDGGGQVIVYAAPRTLDGPAMATATQAARERIPCVVFAEQSAIATKAAQLGLPVFEDFTGSLYAVAWIRHESSPFFRRH